MLLDMVWPVILALVILAEIPSVTTIIGILFIFVGSYFVINE
jgi:drug/metabolite transporter (DMT)-like permease